MQRIWNDIRNHRLASALFMAWWLILTLLNFIVSRRTQASMVQLHFMLPVIAGGLICWWRRSRPARITGGTLAGAIVLVLDLVLLVARDLTDSLARGKGLSKVLKEGVDVEVLVFAAYACIIGAVLGFLGALGGVAFAHQQEAIPDSQSAPDSPRTPAAALADKASVIGGRRIMPRRMLAVAGGLVLLATVILDSGALGRALPPPVTTVNLLAAVALLAPISRWSDDAGRALALIAGLVSFSLGSGVLVFVGFTWAERSAMLSAALSVGALAELGAGVLALIATFRKPDLRYAA